MSLKSNEGTSSSSSRPWWKYDVFVSFSEDTYKNFTDHLCRALDQKGLIFFRDDQKLERGRPIASFILKAIEDSRFSIVVFSKNYAMSVWCLDELAKIFQCMNRENGQTVVPIFYDVQPTEVRKQTGSFKEAFDQHEKDFGTEKLQKWREALTEVANLSGWDLQHRHEATFIQEVTEELWTKLTHSFSSVTKGLVGIDSRLDAINLCLGIGLDDVRIIGICGMGGIGKTTIAQVIFDRFSSQFEGRCFIANVREVSEKYGLATLQEKILCQILIKKKIKILDVHREICNRLRNKRVFIVLDDVDKLKQLETLAGDHEWFGPGSRIIVTTRDEHLLIAHHVEIIYKAESLNSNEALQLFNLKAFKSHHPVEEDYVELSKKIVSYAEGLPLAIVVLGSYLCGRSVNEWRSALKRLKQIPKREIIDVLKVSYYGLEEREKNIFLDISCFFQLKKVDRVIEKLEACDFCPEIGIRALIDKSLVSIENINNRIYVHSLLQEMARNIVHKESPKEPGKRSRLWIYDDIHHLLINKTGTEAVEVIYRNSSESEEIVVDPDAFLGMNSMRLLKIQDVQLPKGLHFLPNDLRVFKWHGYPLKSLPSSFKAEKLVELDLSHSGMELLWKERVHLDMLKIIKLSHSRKMTRTPDFRGIPNLEKLILEGCTSLHELHPSIGDLERLSVLNLKDCRNLQSLPRILSGWRFLKVLVLLGCSKIDKFPENLRDCECLEELDAGKTAIVEAPSSIGTLKNLKKLSFGKCKGQTLKPLNWFRSLLPDAGQSSISFSLPSQLAGLLSLTELDLSYCNLYEESLPTDLGNLSALKKLNLSGNDFVRLPASINQLSKLINLQLADCQKLRALTELPSSIEDLKTYNCPLLKTVSGPLGLLTSNSREFSLQNCFKLLENQGDNDVAVSLLNHHLFLLAKIRILNIFSMFLNFAENQECNDSHIAMLASFVRSWMSYLLRDVSDSTPVMPNLVIFLPGCEISDWFIFQTTKTSITIMLPPNWNNDYTFLGLAFCATLGVKEHDGQEEKEDEQWLPPVMRYIKIHGSKHDYKCRFYLISEEGRLIIFGKECHLNRDQLAQSNHLWLLFISFDQYLQKKDWPQVEAYFRLEKGSGFEFKKCGVRAVYLEDIEFVQTMFQGPNCPRLKDLTIPLSNFVQEAAWSPIIEQSHDIHDCSDEGGPSGTGSSIDEQATASGSPGSCDESSENIRESIDPMIEVKGKRIQE